MDGDKLIKPIEYLKPNQCPKCGKEVCLIEKEVCVATLDVSGIPITESYNYDGVFYCDKCKEKFPVAKKGRHFYIQPLSPPIVREMKEYNPFYIGNILT